MRRANAIEADLIFVEYGNKAECEEFLLRYPTHVYSRSVRNKLAHLQATQPTTQNISDPAEK